MRGAATIVAALTLAGCGGPQRSADDAAGNRAAPDNAAAVAAGERQANEMMAATKQDALEQRVATLENQVDTLKAEIDTRADLRAAPPVPTVPPPPLPPPPAVATPRNAPHLPYEPTGNGAD